MKKTTVWDQAENLLLGQRNHRRWLGLLLCLSMLVSLGTLALLRLNGVAMTAETEPDGLSLEEPVSGEAETPEAEVWTEPESPEAPAAPEEEPAAEPVAGEPIEEGPAAEPAAEAPPEDIPPAGEEISAPSVQRFEAEIEDVTVAVEAAEGTFPPGTTMTAAPVEEETLLDTAAEAAEGAARSVWAVSVEFRGPDGGVLEPEGPVRVALLGGSFAEASVVVRLDEEGRAVPVETEEEPREEEALAFLAEPF